MKRRAITGSVFVVLLIASILYGEWTFSFLFALISVLSLNEFYKIVHTKEMQPNQLIGLILGASLFLLFIFCRMNIITFQQLVLATPFISLIFISELYRKSKHPFINIAYTFFGIIFTTIPFLFFYNLAFLEGHYNFRIPLGFLILLWTNDTGAYLCGMALGKSKLFERHSPKKTWEGFFGGLALSLIAAIILSNCFQTIHLWQWVTSGFIVSIFGTYGDLSESMLKRSYQIKDSGNILPGHGGLLDRFDGLLLAAPLVYWLLALTI